MKTFWLAVTFVVFTLVVAPSANALTTTCADNETNCGGTNPDQTDGTTYNTSGQSVICRATWGDPSTFCFIQTWVWDSYNECMVHGPCSRGYTSSGWCVCKEAGGYWYKLEGSCTFR